MNKVKVTVSGPDPVTKLRGNGAVVVTAKDVDKEGIPKGVDFYLTGDMSSEIFSQYLQVMVATMVDRFRSVDATTLLALEAIVLGIAHAADSGKAPSDRTRELCERISPLVKELSKELEDRDKNVSLHNAGIQEGNPQ